MAPGPAPNCLTCSKRQVRCDGDRPTCRRCPKDNLECRGYKDQLRIVQVHPTQRRSTAVQRKPKAGQQTQGQALFLAKNIFLGDRDLWTLLDCAQYFNQHVIPTIFPAERPFFRPSIGPEVAWQHLPKVCLHFIIVAFQSTRAAKLLIDPLSQPDLCYYRGLGLRELPQHLEEAVTDPQGIALVSIIMLMMSDLLAVDGSWRVHLNAVQRIVALRGGVRTCITSMPDSVFMLVQFFVVDTLTSTACNSAGLSQTPFCDMIVDIPHIDFQLITCASTCPSEIFQVIAHTNALRRRRWDGRRQLGQESSSTFAADYDELLDDLRQFDCKAWANRMSHLGLSFPVLEAHVAPCSSIDGLTTVAECFRSAAQVYLFLSYCSQDDETAIDHARQASKALHGGINTLFENASSERDDPLDTQLWKFASWPLVIAAYAWVGWDITEESTTLDTMFAQLRAIYVAKGTQVRSSTEQHMKSVQARRARNPDLQWTWDMGFPERMAFAL